MVNWISRRDVDQAGAGIVWLMVMMMVVVVIIALVPPVLIGIGIYLIVKRTQYGLKSLVGGIAAILVAAAIVVFIWVPTYVNKHYYGDLDTCHFSSDADYCGERLHDEGFTNITFVDLHTFYYCGDATVTSVPAPKGDNPRLAKKTAHVTVDFNC